MVVAVSLANIWHAPLHVRPWIRTETSMFWLLRTPLSIDNSISIVFLVSRNGRRQRRLNVADAGRFVDSYPCK